MMDGSKHDFRHAKQLSLNQFPGVVQKQVRDKTLSEEVTSM